MYRIAVVEDDANFSLQVKDYFAQFCNQTNESGIFVKYFSDGDEIASDYESNFDIIFMDVQMKRLDGMSAAQEIRKFDKNVIIVFITNMAQYAIKSYSVGATDYLLKPLSYFVFSEQLKKLLEIVRKKATIFLYLPMENGIIKMPSDSILFIESFKHKLIVHTIEGDYQITETMKNIETKLAGKNFFRSNSCYIVNLQHIKKFTGSVIYIKDYELSISRPKKKEFLQVFSEFIGGIQ